MADLPRYTVVYFDIRGRAEPIRLLLEHLGESWRDRGLQREEWRTLKPDLGLGQLPVLIEHRGDGDRTIPQSAAILRHLGRAHGAYGRDANEMLAADVAGETAADVRGKLSDLRFSPAWQDAGAKAKFGAETAPLGLARLSKLLDRRDFFASVAPTWADMLAFDTLEGHATVWPGALDPFANLTAFVERMRNLPKLQPYLASRRPSELTR